VSYFCKFCGKVLTTGDDIDRCNPDCSQKSMPVFEIEQISWDILKYQNDQLKAENDRYKEKNLEWQKKYDTDTEKLRAENERLKEAAKGLICSLPDSEIDMCSDVWGWTNIGVLKHWRDKLQQALNEVEE